MDAFLNYNFYSSIRDQLLILILLLFYFFAPKGADYLLIWFCLCIFYYYFYKSLISPVVIYKQLRSFVKIDLLFLLFYYILFYFPYQTYVLGIGNLKESAYLRTTFWEYSNISITTSTIGLIAFVNGVNSRIRIKDKGSPFYYSKIRFNILYVLVLCVLPIIMYFYFRNAWGVITEGAYGGTRTNDSTLDGIYLLISFFINILVAFSIFYILKFRKINIFITTFSAICGVYLLNLLVQGDRNTFFLTAVIIGGGVSTYLMKITRLQLFAMVVAALFLYQVVELARSRTRERGVDVIISAAMGELDDTHSRAKIGGRLDEGSFSITNVVTRSAFYYVPEKYDYFFGYFKLIGTVGLIPYLAGTLWDKNSIDYYSSAIFFTENIGSYFGLGTSIIADIYIDFGIIGVIFLMFLLGYWVSYVTQKARMNSHSLKWLSVYLMTMSVYSQVCRYAYTSVFKYIVWCLTIFFLYELLIKILLFLGWRVDEHSTESL